MKRVLSVILCLVMLFTCFTIAANASTYTIDINSTDAASGDKWSWDGSTLELDGYSGGAIGIHIDTDVTIMLKGTNTVSGNAFGIDTNTSITFKGEGNLTVSAANPAIQISGGGKQLNFNGTGTIALTSTELEGVFVDGQVIFTSGTVTISGSPAVVAYGVTKKDNLNNINLDANLGEYGISKGSDMAYYVNNTETNLVETQINGSNETDEYTTDSYVTDAYGNTLKKRYDTTNSYYVIDKYDAYGNLVDTYADNATKATWSWTSTYELKTLSTGSVNVNIAERAYTGSVENSITVKKKATDKITPKDTSGYEKINENGVAGDKYLTNVADCLSVTDFFNNLVNENSRLKLFKSDGTTLVTSGYVATGYIVKLYDGSNVIDSIVVIVPGDCNGDGEIKSGDYVKIRKEIMDEPIVGEVYRIAADINKVSGITSADYVRVRKIIMDR